MAPDATTFFELESKLVYAHTRRPVPFEGDSIRAVGKSGSNAVSEFSTVTVFTEELILLLKAGLPNLLDEETFVGTITN